MPPPLSSVSEGKLAERERVALYPRLEAELEEVFADPADVDEPVKALPLDCRGPTVDIAARQAVGPHPPEVVDQVLRGPVLVAEGVPGRVVVVLDDGVADAVVRDPGGDVRGTALKRELGRVDADDRQPVAAVPLVPRLHVGERPQAVDAGIGPEVDQHDAPTRAQPREPEPAATRCVEPALG